MCIPPRKARELSSVSNRQATKEPTEDAPRYGQGQGREGEEGEMIAQHWLGMHGGWAMIYSASSATLRHLFIEVTAFIG